jgi:hypothetical protein
MNHIKTTNDDNQSWCGKTIGLEFHFKDAEQAALNGIHGSKTACPHCIDRIIECLNKNRSQLESES